METELRGAWKGFAQGKPASVVLQFLAVVAVLGISGLGETSCQALPSSSYGGTVGAGVKFLLLCGIDFVGLGPLFPSVTYLT